MASELRNVYFSFLYIALGGLLFGYIIGANSNIVTKGQLLCEDGYEGVKGTLVSNGYTQCYELTPILQGFASSLTLIGACLSSLFCFRYADEMGRKREVQTGAVLYATGAALAALAPNLVCIYSGLLVYGLGIGFAMHAAPVYIAEISPAGVRGMLVSAKEAFIVFGIFLGFLTGFLTSGIHGSGWRWMVGSAGFIAVLMRMGIAFVPESPRFLVLKLARSGALLGTGSKLMDEAREALQFFRGADSSAKVAEELRTMYHDASASLDQEPSRTQCAEVFRYPLPLVIGCGLVFLQQVTGQPSVLYFATNIFKAAHFGENAAISSVSVGFVKLIATLFTVWRVDQYGRRLLLFIGISMMAVALAILTVVFAFHHQTCNEVGVSVKDCDHDDVGVPSEWGLVTVLALMLYVSGFQVSFGPISWLMISEIFPLGVRGAAMSLAAMVNFGTNIVMTLTQVVLLEALTPSVVFGLYFLMSIVSIVFVYAIVPETKGKTLEQIERELAGGSRAASSH